MVNCQNLKFSEKNREKRIKYASKLFGEKVLKKLIFFVLYLLGAENITLSKTLDIPIDTLKSLLRRIKKNGLSALEDRRYNTSSFLPVKRKELPKPTVKGDDQTIYIKLSDKNIITIPKKNNLQCKAVLLTFLKSGIFSTNVIAKILGISVSHTIKTKNELYKNDISALVDKRKGQQKDYLFTKELKSELIQQFTVNTVIGRTTSSSVITSQVNKACNSTISARTVRHHISRLGLNKIKYSLPNLLNKIKKKSKL